jgi:hypothetical protein
MGDSIKYTDRPQTSATLNGPTYSPTATTTFPVLNAEMSASLSTANTLRSRTFFTPEQHAIHQGMLEKCCLPDGWTKIKPKQWTNVYAFLYSGHLLFYRDQKSAEVGFVGL